MKAYRYNSENKKYEGETTCQIDPLESKLAGKEVYLLPADCTYEEPLPEKEGFDIIFNGTAWEYKEEEKKPEDEPYVPTEKEKTQWAIWKLKSKLAETDYKVLKCTEASLCGQELPYDLDAVVSERDGWRSQINELEEKLKTIKESE
jgi:hypothetical protein